MVPRHCVQLAAKEDILLVAVCEQYRDGRLVHCTVAQNGPQKLKNLKTKCLLKVQLYRKLLLMMLPTLKKKENMWKLLLNYRGDAGAGAKHGEVTDFM